MTFYSLGAGNRYLGDSQTRCRNSCLALKGHAGHLWPAFSLPRSGFLEMPRRVEAETAGPTSGLAPCLLLWPPGSSGLRRDWDQVCLQSLAGSPWAPGIVFCFPQHRKSFAEAQGASTKCSSPAFWRLFIFGSRQSCGGAGQDRGPSRLQQRVRCGDREMYRMPALQDNGDRDAGETSIHKVGREDSGSL